MNHSAILSPNPPESSSGKIGERIYEDLRRRIISFDLKPDLTLSRSELMAQYNASQAPLREALQQLDQEGLVRIYPQSRTVVARINSEQIYEAHFLRVALECEVARGLALAPDAECLGRARSIIRMQEAVGNRPEQVTMVQELDEAFHGALFSGLGRDRLHRLIRAQSGHLERARRLHKAQSRVGSIIAGHIAVVEAIEAGDSDRAAAQMRAHLGGTISHIADLRARFPNYFA